MTVDDDNLLKIIHLALQMRDPPTRFILMILTHAGDGPDIQMFSDVRPEITIEVLKEQVRVLEQGDSQHQMGNE